MRARQPWRLLRLENRLVPASVVWDGGAGNGLWSDPVNWVGDTLPAAGDDVTITSATPVTFDPAAPGVALGSLTVQAPFFITGGVLDVAGASAFADAVTQSGGTFQGAGVATFFAGVTFAGGTWAGTGKNVVPAGASLAIQSNAAPILLARSVDLAGAGTWTGTADLPTGGGGTFTIKSGGAFDMQAGAVQWSWGVAPAPVAITVESGGSLSRSTQDAAIIVNAAINNAGTVTVSKGTLAFYGGTSSGKFQIDGRLSHIAGALTAHTGATFAGPGVFSLSSGLAAAGDATISCFLQQSGGSINGAGTVTIAGGGIVTSGNWSGTGKTVIAAGSIFNIETKTSPFAINQRRVDNFGTAVWTGNQPILTSVGASGLGAWVNKPGAIFLANATADWGKSSPTLAASPFTNEAGATFQHNPAATMTFAGAFSNGGTLLQQAGALNFAGGLTSTGAFNVSPGSTAAVTGAFNPPTGAVALGGEVSAGSLNLAAAVNVTLAPPTASGRFVVNGGVTLSGLFSATTKSALAVGDTFTIVDNTGPDPIAGTFSGLPEGATLPIGGAAATISYVGGTGNDVTLTVTKATPPPLATVQVNAGHPQRSMVTSVVVTFNEPVSFPDGPAAAFQLQRVGPGSPIGLVGLGFAFLGNQVTITFDDPVYASGSAKSLINGNYSLTLVADKILGAAGPLDGNADGTGGDNQVTSFHRLFGDVNADKIVNSSDFLAFRLAFLGTNPAFDVNGDGTVNSTDFLAFRLAFLTTLP